MSKLTGAEIVIECLKEQGVDTVFGYPGGAILNIYDALYQHQNEITHILTSHEQGASHAADGYARATGKVGVCLATSGPGATNLVTGIATAYMDSVPVVAITCNVANSLLGKDSFQEIDITGVTMPITKYNFIVKDINKLAKVIRRAFVIAQSGRPGPVLVDITKDVTAATADYEYQEPEKIEPQTDTIKEEDMERALEMIRKAQKPFIFVGGGAIISNASEELRVFAHKIQAPVADSLMGKGAFDGADELYTGMVGMHGTKTSNYGITEADLLVVVGARFSDRVIGNASKFAKNAKILQIDIDRAEINKNIKVDASIIGDAKTILRRLNTHLDPINHDEWIAHIERMKDMYPLRYNKNVLTGPFIIQTVNEVTGGDAVIVTEVGQHQMWTAQAYPLNRPRQWLTSGGLGTMGFGLPAAIGAALANPQRKVICFSGDGSLMMNIQEMATAAENQLDVKIILLNNEALGLVHQQQSLFYQQGVFAATYPGMINFMQIAAGFGLQTCDLNNEVDPQAALQAIIDRPGPALIHVRIDAQQKVYPMVPPGAANTEMVGE